VTALLRSHFASVFLNGQNRMHEAIASYIGPKFYLNKVKTPDRLRGKLSDEDPMLYRALYRIRGLAHLTPEDGLATDAEVRFQWHSKPTRTATPSTKSRRARLTRVRW
jgi:hypothetical protein